MLSQTLYNKTQNSHTNNSPKSTIYFNKTSSRVLVLSFECYYVPVEVVEEGKQVERQFDPPFTLAPLQHVSIHYARGVVQSRPRHDRPVAVSVYVIGYQWDVQHQG